MKFLRSSSSTVLQSGIRAALVREAHRFARASDHPEAAQRERLEAILRAVRGSTQSRRLGLARVRTAHEFQDAVPVRGAEALTQAADALRAGDLHALTAEAPVRFELSGGSSGASKYVPVTPGLLSEFHRALAPWLFDLLSARPALRRGPSYWSISPLGDRQGRVEAGIPVGSVSDSSYFPALLRPFVERVLAVPGEVALLSDVEACRYVTLRCLLERADVAFISVWNPSFLTLLLEALDAHADRLADELEAGTCRPSGTSDPGVLSRIHFGRAPRQAQRLRELYRASRAPTARAVFEGLSLVSCWTDADAARALPPLTARLGDVEVQSKGLLATEGVVTFPLFSAPAPVLAVRSHFYEFIDAERPDARPLLAHELEGGRSYDVVMSTSGGLLRYRLGDRVRVEGFHRRTPCLRFLGRADAVVDLVGEKLSATWASHALAESLQQLPAARSVEFAMLAPEWTSPPAYHLFVEGALPDAALEELGRALDERLESGHAYGYARRLGQLGRVKVVRVSSARARYEARCIALGQRAGDIKPVDLHRQPGWLTHFGGGVA